MLIPVESGRFTRLLQRFAYAEQEMTENEYHEPPALFDLTSPPHKEQSKPQGLMFDNLLFPEFGELAPQKQR
ncbi:hypothetical protein [Coleofasciculus sp.]|uniref:hypothetical protein n=1 Tax=Coleofasciculus sp. TaxID=3100458 RepID=UPI003A1743EB